MAVRKTVGPDGMPVYSRDPDSGADNRPVIAAVGADGSRIYSRNPNYKGPSQTSGAALPVYKAGGGESAGSPLTPSRTETSPRLESAWDSRTNAQRLQSLFAGEHLGNEAAGGLQMPKGLQNYQSINQDYARSLMSLGGGSPSAGSMAYPAGSQAQLKAAQREADPIHWGDKAAQLIGASKDPLYSIASTVDTGMNLMVKGAQERVAQEEAIQKGLENPDASLKEISDAMGGYSPRGIIGSWLDQQIAKIPVEGEKHPWIQEREASMAKAQAQLKDGLNPVQSFVADAALSGINMASDAVTVGSLGVPFLAYMSTASGADAAQRALDEGYSAGQAALYGMGAGAITGAIESFGGIAGSWGKSLSKTKVGQSVISRLPAKAVDFVAKLSATKVGQLAGDALSEGAEEFTEYYAQNFFENLALDKDTPPDIREALYNAGVGAAVGGMFGGGRAFASGIAENRAHAQEGSDPAENANQDSNRRQLLEKQIDLALQDIEIDNRTDISPPAGSEVTRQSQRRYLQQLKRVIQGEYPARKEIVVSGTPTVLRAFGAADLPLTMSQSTMWKMAYPSGYMGVKHGHNLGFYAIENLPYQLEDPVAIMKSDTQPNSLVVFTEFLDERGDPVIVPVHLDKQGRIALSNEIASAYGKADFLNFVNRQKEKGNLLYERDEKGLSNLPASGLQLPGVASSIDPLSNPSVAETTPEVNNSISMGGGNHSSGGPGTAGTGNVGVDDNLPGPYNQGGGEKDGREERVYHPGGRLGDPQNDPQGQASASPGGLRGDADDFQGTGRAREGNSQVYLEDSRGQRIAPELSRRLEGTRVVDGDGRPVAVEHFTPNMEFEAFGEGDTGFHFGTREQAQGRAAQKGGQGRVIRAYLNIQSPIRVASDIMNWKAKPLAMRLYADGILSRAEYSVIGQLSSQGLSYSSPAAVELRRLLREKGYDGIVYPNGYEGDGDSYIALYPEQVVIFDDGRRTGQAAPFGPGTVGAAESAFPRRTRTSQFRSNTVENTPMFTEAERAMLSSDFFQYDVVSERQSMAEARQRLETDFDGEVRDLPEKAYFDGTDVDTAMGIAERFGAEAAEAGPNSPEAERFAKWVKTTQERLTDASHALQALAKYTRTAEGAVVKAQQVVDKARKDIEKTRPNQAKQLAKSMELSTAEMMDIYNFHKKAMGYPEGSYERAMWCAKADKIVGNKIPKTFKDQFITFLMDSMLGSLRTLISRNAGGNLMFAIPETIKQYPAAGLDALVSLATGTRTRTAPNAEKLAAYLNGLKTGAREAWTDYREGVSTQSGNYIPDVEVGARMNAKAFSDGTFIGHLANEADRLVGAMLSLGDRPFFQAAYNQRMVELRQIKEMAMLGGKVDGQVFNESNFDALAPVLAKMDALEATFQNKGIMPEAFRALKTGVDKVGEAMTGVGIAGQFAMPFTNTTANLFVRNIEYTPFGTVKNAVKTAKELHQGTFDQRRFVDETARNLVGSALFFAAGALFKAGFITGDLDDDKDKRAAQYAVGMQPNAIKIGDSYYSYDWIPVLGPSLSAGAAFARAWEEEDNPLLAGSGAAFRTAMETSALQGLTRMLGGQNLASSVADTMLGGTSQAVPSIVRQVANATDQYQRQTYDPNPVKDQMNYVASSIPGLRQLLPIKTETSGRPIEQNQGRGTASRLFENLISPGKLTTLREDPVYDEAFRLSEAIDGDLKNVAFPRVAEKTYEGVDGKRKFTAEEYNAYSQKLGELQYSAAEALIRSPLYQNLSDEEKAKVLQDIYGQAAAAAKKDVLGDKYSVAQSYQKALEAMDHGIPLEKYNLVAAIDDADGNGSVSKKEYENALKRVGLTASERSYLLALRFPKR